MINLTVKGSYLPKLTASDATENYALWLNNPTTNRSLQIRHGGYSVSVFLEFIETTNSGPASCLFGISTKDTDRHVGNIKISYH